MPAVEFSSSVLRANVAVSSVRALVLLFYVAFGTFCQPVNWANSKARQLSAIIVKTQRDCTMNAAEWTRRRSMLNDEREVVEVT